MSVCYDEQSGGVSLIIPKAIAKFEQLRHGSLLSWQIKGSNAFIIRNVGDAE